MDGAIQTLKERSTSGQEMRTLLALSTVSRGKPTKRKVWESLDSIDEHTLAKRIRDCHHGQECSSPYCNRCRKRMAIRLEERLTRRFEETFSGSNNLLMVRWRYATILCELVPLDDDLVLHAVRRARKVRKALRRQFPNLWLRGAFEFELVNLDTLRWYPNSEKSKTLLAMLDGDDQRFRGKMVLVHFHAVVDVADHDDNEIKKWFRQGKRYGKHPRQVRIQRTRANQSASDKIHKLAWYSFKNRFKFNHSFETMGFEDEEYIGLIDMGKLIKTYHHVMKCGAKSFKSILVGVG